MDLERIFPQGHVCLFSSNDYIKVWRITNIPAGTLNYLRIWLQDSLVSTSIDMVQIRENTSTFYDEYIAHRLGLIPINTDPLRMTNFDEKDYDLCSETTCIEFNLNVNNPTQDIKNVLSRDLIWNPIGNQAQMWQDRPPKPLYDNLLIAKLLPGQEINLRCYAVRGTNAQHAKWGSVFTHFRRVSKKPTQVNVYTKLSQITIRPTGLLTGGSMLSQLNATPSRINRNFLQYLATLLNLSERELSSMIQDPNYGNVNQLTDYLNNLFGINPPLTQNEVRQMIELTLPIFQESRIILPPVLVSTLSPAQPLSLPSTTGCVPCEQINVDIQPGNNCYYFTVELVGGLTFSDINRQLIEIFDWGTTSFSEQEYIY